MQVNKVFVSINAKDHLKLVDWWTKAIGRKHDREPMPSCREWDLTADVLFQVLDASMPGGPTSVALHVEDVAEERARLLRQGIELSEPTKVDGFDSLMWSKTTDPEGNELNLLSGQ